VKTKPCDFKSTVNERGDQVSINAKIKVLTSQHEDMFFRVKVRALEPKTKREFNPPLEVISAPIKVISKPKQMKKRKTTKRRSLNDMLIETVQRIESQQQSQQENLEHIIRRRKRKATERSGGFKAPAFPTSSLNNGMSISIPQINNNNFNMRNPMASSNNNNNNNNNSGSNWDPSASPEEELVVAIGQFFSSYEQLDSQDRPTKIRRVMRSWSTREAEQLSELFDVLISSGFDDDLDEKEEKKKDDYPAAPEGCNCLACPHKLELEKIDEFYKDFLASEIPLMEAELDGELGEH